MDMHLSLRGKTAVVTGGSRGIGAGIALELGKRGANVIIIHSSASSAPAAQEIIHQINTFFHQPTAFSLTADLKIPSQVDNLVIQWRKKGISTIDILVNNAGVELVKPLGTITPEEFSSVYDLNVRGTLLMTQAVLPFLPRKGRIINIGSVGGRAGFANLGLYCSSKAALEGLTRCWAVELGKNGITVNTVNPGPVQSEMLDNIPKDIVDAQKADTPIENRVGTVDEIAKVVVWLASDDASWVTGQAISASGGWAMY